MVIRETLVHKRQILPKAQTPKLQVPNKKSQTTLAAVWDFGIETSNCYPRFVIGT
jgi:hypothetical protein